MRSQVWAVAAAAAVAAGVVLAPPSTAAPNRTQALAPARGHIVGAGTITLAGRPEAGAQVSVFAMPSQASLDAAGVAGLRMLPLGQATTGASGRFELRSDLSTIDTRYRAADGAVQMMLVASDAARELNWQYSVYTPGRTPAAGSSAALTDGIGQLMAGRSASGALAPVLEVDLGTGAVDTVGNRRATWLDEQGRALGAARAKSGGHAAVGRPTRGLASYASAFLAAPTATRTSLLRTVRSVSGVQTEDPAAGTVTPQVVCGLVSWLNNYKNNIQEHYLNVYSFSGAKVTVTEGTSGSFSATLGIVQQTSSGFSASGTAAKTWSNSDSLVGVADASISNRINYRQQNVSCTLGSLWQPYSVYSTITDVVQAPDTNYTYCQSKLSGTLWATGATSNATWSGGVTFPGISVSAQSGYGTSQDLTFNFTSSGFICGNSAQGPSSSSQISARA